MKNFVILSLLTAFVVDGAVIPPNINSTEFYHAIGQKRQALGLLTSMMGKTILVTIRAVRWHDQGKGGKVADVPGATPKKQLIKTESQVPGVKRIKMRYGPYKVPNMNTKGITGEAGSLWKYVFVVLFFLEREADHPFSYPDTNIAKVTHTAYCYMSDLTRW